MHLRWLWQLGTGWADYSSQSTPKKEMHKVLEYTQEYNLSVTQNNS